MRILSTAGLIKPRLTAALLSRLRFHSRLNSVQLSPNTRSSSNPMRTSAIAFSSSSSTEESLPKRLFNKFVKEAVFASYSPFALCLVAGTLNIDTFRHYIAQDVHFLKAFARAYELAEDCADDDDAKLVISELRKDVLEELKMHDSFAREWGLDVAKEIPVNSVTIKYTEFLLATASGKVEVGKGPGKLATPFERTKVAAYTLGAMTPCMRLYAFLGKEFKGLLDHIQGPHPYKSWIDNYASEGFQASALKTEDLLEKLSVSLTSEELDIIEKLYQQAMKLEIEFFHAQPISQPTVVPLTRDQNPAEDHLLIFSDFDLTCSVVDSSAILAEMAIVKAPKSDLNQPEGQISRMSSTELKNTWAVISNRYTEEYEACIKNIMPPQKVEFNYDALHKALEQVSDFEKKANSRVIESSVLKGIHLEDIKRAGEHMKLRDGCASFFLKIVKDENLNTDVHILSCSWSGDLIKMVFLSAGVDVLNVHANELVLEESISTGELVRKMESPIDKLEAFKNILKDRISGKKNLTVYIGDTMGDLLCLLEADIGIVIASSPSIKRLGKRYGISFVPLYRALVKKQNGDVEGSFSNCKGRHSGVLYTVQYWDEIHAFILGW
ncbi:hypothetical protein SLA2020_467790 [Shorea laevis]